LLGIRNDENKTDLLDDIIIDINQAQEMAHIYSNILAGTMDTFASIISNNLNIVIQRLTLITIVLMVPTLVASFFGMNVYMPFGIGEIQNGVPFWGIIAGAALLSGLLVFMFRKQRML
jgi:magnesium transporter